jgi:selenium-binding protein 1
LEDLKLWSYFPQTYHKGGDEHHKYLFFADIFYGNKSKEKIMSKVTNTRKSFVVGLVVLSILVLTVGVASAKGFTHVTIIVVNGEDYYMTGAQDGPNGTTDIPGHSWVQAGPNKVVGKHYNSGPFGASQWWTSDAADGALLFKVDGIIDTWSTDKAAYYDSRGYVHYHELVSAADGALHPTKVVWLKHTAVSFFNFDRGPHPEQVHEVSPGVDNDFIPNGFMEYIP